MNPVTFFSVLLALCLAAVSGYAASAKTILINSEKMDKEIPATVILPEIYIQTTNSCPVLYLLHGAGGNYASWLQSTPIMQLADQYGIIVLCPDGNRTSWYFDSPIDPTSCYETFVAMECTAYMDSHYRTRADRNHRALCGFSMGGHGAFYLAIRHWETFGIASSISGGVDIRPFPHSWELPRRLGEQSDHPGNWETHTVINQAKSLQKDNLYLSMECGTEDFFLEVNRALDKQLTAAGIDHAYAEHPGAHTGEYRAEAIKRQMAWIADQMPVQGKQD